VTRKKSHEAHRLRHLAQARPARKLTRSELNEMLKQAVENTPPAEPDKQEDEDGGQADKLDG
jgi:hypothetical protein